MKHMSPSKQARADALADAETLRLVAFGETDRRKVRRLTQFYLGEVNAHINAALGWFGFDEEMLAYSAEEAARAAFRAIPGLKQA